MLQTEIKLIKNRKLILPVAILVSALLFIAFLSFWVGTEKKQLEGVALAAFISIKATQSTILALFFLFWMLQFSIHLQNTGFYKMLLLFGWKRSKLFIYVIFQISIYSISLMCLNFVGFALLSLLYSTNPFHLIINTEINALLSQFFYLFAVGLFGVTLGFMRANHILILPVFVYWLFEGWLNTFLLRKFETNIGDFFPLQALKLIISEKLLQTEQLLAIAFYSTIFLMLFHFSVQKKKFV